MSDNDDEEMVRMAFRVLDKVNPAIGAIYINILFNIYKYTILWRMNVNILSQPRFLNQ